MSDHVYKKIELVGSSPNGMEDAVKNALARAKKTVRNMRCFEVAETRARPRHHVLFFPFCLTIVREADLVNAKSAKSFSPRLPTENPAVLVDDGTRRRDVIISDHHGPFVRAPARLEFRNWSTPKS